MSSDWLGWTDTVLDEENKQLFIDTVELSKFKFQLFHFYSAAHTQLFDIPVIHVNALMSRISTLKAHTDTLKAILCNPRTYQRGHGGDEHETWFVEDY